MQLSYALLTDGVLEQSAVDEWKKNELNQYEQKKTTPLLQIADAFAKVIYGDDVRMAPLTPEIINRQERSPAEAWFKRIAGHAAIEVGVVGDIKLEDATNLIARYVGSLPKRTGTFDELNALRQLKRGPGPYSESVRIKAIANQAVTVAGFISCDELDPARRPLTLASMVLTERMNDRIREKERLVYSIQATNQPGRAISGTGLFFGAAPTDPKNVDKLAQVIIEMFRDFAEKGCTDDELATAKKQVANMLKDQMKEPSYWMQQIGDMQYRGRQLAEMKLMPGIYQTFTESQLQDAFKKYFKDESIVKIEIAPESAAAPATEAPATEPAGR
jgi:zinc protease